MNFKSHTLLIAAAALAATLLSACDRRSDTPGNNMPATPSASAPMGGASTP